MKKILIFMAIFILWATSLSASLYDKKMTIKQTYEKFSDNFRNKKFEKCLRYLSDKDFKKYQNLAKLNNWQGSVDELLLKELENIWNLYYNDKQKEQHIQELEEMRIRDLEEMEKVLQEMEDVYAAKKEIEDFKQQVENAKFNIDEQILLMKAETNILGKILKKQIIKDKAMIAVEFEYIFSEKLLKDVDDIFIKKQENSYNVAKVRDLSGKMLKMCFLYAFEKNDENIWKILFFSRDMFDETNFTRFINKYEKDILSSDADMLIKMAEFDEY